MYQNFQELERSINFRQVQHLLKKSRLSTEEEQKVEEFTSRQRVSVISSISDVSERRMTVKGPQRDITTESDIHEKEHQYYTYFNSNGKCCSVSTVALSLSPALLETLLRLWLSLIKSPPQLDFTSTICLLGYLGGWLVLSILSRYCLYSLLIGAASRYHRTIIDHVAHSPLSFFTSTPLTHILSVFKSDLDLLEFTHPLYFALLVNTLWLSISWIITSLMAIPYLLVSLLLLALFLLLLMKTTIPVITRSLYYEEQSRSTLQSYVSDTQEGLMTIKAYQLQDHFLSYFLSLVNHNAMAILTYHSFSSFLGFYSNVISALFAFSFLGIALLVPQIHSNQLLMSLGLTSAILLNEYIHSFTHYSACVLSQCSKAKRVMHFAELPVEPGQQYSFFAGEWPSKGHIFFHNVDVLSQQTHQPILRGISFEALPGQKIGIIGDREGGQSKLLQTLLRIKIHEPGSAIAIDGINIAEVDLQTLRASISLIPQIPFFMDASIRENIDPYFDYTDHQIWNALRKVNLNVKISRLSNQLNEKAPTCISQLSPLQQQFFFLARAILKNNRILVIDEPSGGESKELLRIVEKVSEEAKWTQLIFAQTIESIIDADNVLVISSGEALQYAHPYNLLQESEGLFANMINALDPERARSLRARAYSSYSKSAGLTRP